MGFEASSIRLNRILSSIAAETPEARSKRWQGLFDALSAPFTHQLVLFGTGELGRWVLGRLRKAGVEPLCFVDNNQARWGAQVDGLNVLSPSDAIRLFGHSACFVVTIYNGSAVRKQLREAGCVRVLAAPLLFWKFPDEFMPDLGIDAPERLFEQVDQIRQCFSILSDEQSRQEFCDQIEWRYTMEQEYLPLPTNLHELYFPDDLISENDEEVLVDCGAFDGDSIRSFMRRGRSFQHIYALEPDPSNFAGLCVSISTLPPEVAEKATAWPFAVGDENGQLKFAPQQDVTSKVTASSDGITIESRRLDSLEWSHKPTYIKMDIEGYEPIALAGAAALLNRDLPVLAICLYHRTEHLWQIPNLIHSLQPAYSLYLRRYAEDCWEQVCYAVPPNRIIPR